MTVVTVADLENAKLDVQTIAEVAMVGYSSDTTTNRDGDVINTLQGQLKLLGFQPPVTYAAAIVFDAMDYTKTISYSGVVYFPDPNALPFTTTGTWVADDELKFFVVQSIGAIAASSITCVPPAGRVATNVQDMIDEYDTAMDLTDTNLATVTTKENNLITLSGVAANATSLGTFTGTTISNNRTNKQALQDIETAYESTVVRKALSSGGSANAITATCAPTLSSLTNGAVIIVKPAYNSTNATVTFSPDGLAAKNIRRWDGALQIGDIDVNIPMILMYNSTDLEWKLLNPKYAEVKSGSGVQVYDGDGKTFTIAHSLGVVPSIITPYAFLQTGPDVGYSSGARVILANCADVTYEADATNIYIHVSTGGISIINKSTYANGTMSTASKWDIGVECIA